MNNALQVFNYEGREIRTVEIDGEAWFVGKDVAEALSYKDTDQAIRVHVDDEDKLTRQFNGSGQRRDMTVINESGVYALIFSSKLPSARQFKRWVTHEVLPAIRRNGSYAIAKCEPVEPEIVAPKKVQKIGYITRATVKAIENIFDRAAKCKEKEDFEAVIALDKVFEAAHGYSPLKSAGWKVVSNGQWDRVYFSRDSIAYTHFHQEYEDIYVAHYEWEKPDITQSDNSFEF